ncbi:MAG: phosphoadenosine phosphosulfate reductase family protein [Bacilli bacterium]
MVLELINSNRKESFKDNNWTTRIKLGSKKTNTYSCFPLYDWTAPDIWTAVSKLNLKFNEIYEQMYKNGVTYMNKDYVNHMVMIKKRD